MRTKQHSMTPGGLWSGSLFFFSAEAQALAEHKAESKGIRGAISQPSYTAVSSCLLGFFITLTLEGDTMELNQSRWSVRTCRAGSDCSATQCGG